MHGWAGSFRDGAGFVAILGPAGDIVRVHEPDTVSFGNRCVSHALQEAVTREAASWIYYDPFDWPEYAWLEWTAVMPQAWRRLLGPDADADAIPPSWGVMF